jgi:hypothetical protein
MNGRKWTGHQKLGRDRGAEQGAYGAQVQEKLDPSLESAEHVDVCGLLELLLLSITIVLTAGKLPIGPVVELSLAQLVAAIPVLSLPKVIVPKSDNGKIPPESVQQGASAIHSADDRMAPDTLALLLKDFPVVSSVIETVMS